MKKLLSVIFLLLVACFTVSCGVGEENAISSEPQHQSQSRESNVLSAELSEESGFVSTEDTVISETTSEEISTVDTTPDRIVGGYTISYEPYYSFSFNDGIELDRWLSGCSDFHMLNDKLEKVKIHENKVAEKLRLLLKDKNFYYPTIIGKIQKTSPIEVWQMYDNCAYVQYTVYGEGGVEYDISFKYFFDEESLTWLDGGIVNYYTKLYNKTGSIGLSQKYVYCISSLPIYDHMNYRMLDTEVVVAQFGEDVSVCFAFNGILLKINGSPLIIEEGSYTPENYDGLGFYDMTYVEAIS